MSSYLYKHFSYINTDNKCGYRINFLIINDYCIHHHFYRNIKTSTYAFMGYAIKDHFENNDDCHPRYFYTIAKRLTFTSFDLMPCKNKLTKCNHTSWH